MNLPQVFVDAAREAGERLEGWESMFGQLVYRKAPHMSLRVHENGRISIRFKVTMELSDIPGLSLPAAISLACRLVRALERITITETAEGGRTEFSTYQAQDHGEGKIEDSLPEGFWDRGVMFPMKDVGTQIEIRRLNEDHGEGEG